VLRGSLLSVNDEYFTSLTLEAKANPPKKLKLQNEGEYLMNTTPRNKTHKK
jgi:hypothetical protein